MPESVCHDDVSRFMTSGEGGEFLNGIRAHLQGNMIDQVEFLNNGEGITTLLRLSNGESYAFNDEELTLDVLQEQFSALFRELLGAASASRSQKKGENMMEPAVVIDLEARGIPGENNARILAEVLQRCQPGWSCQYCEDGQEQQLIVTGYSEDDAHLIPFMADAAAEVITGYLAPHTEALEHILTLAVENEDRDNTIDNAFATAAECIATAREALNTERRNS